MDGQQHQLKKAMEDLGKQIAEESDFTGLASIPDDLKKMAAEISKDSASAKEAMGLTDATIEGIYGQAYRLYNTGKYKEASQLFRLLMLLDPKQNKYLLGQAACFHMLKEFKNAVPLYTLCALLDDQSPIPHYHTSDCYIQMKDFISAVISLEMAVSRAGDKPEYQILKDRSLLTIENLKKELQPKNL